MVIDTRKIDEMARQLAENLPEGLQHLRSDMERNFRESLQAALGRLDVVTREGFDAQAEVLGRARARLEALEARLAELEEQNRDQ